MFVLFVPNFSSKKKNNIGMSKVPLNHQSQVHFLPSIKHSVCI